MSEIVIRIASLQDLARLKAISVRTFQDSFGDQNTSENMEQYFRSSFSAEKLSEELQNPFSSFYFAELDTIPIGYLKINWGASQTELQAEKSLEIERIYVEKEFQGKHVGQLLLNKAMAVANEKLATSIWLGVWEKNGKAIRFYQKNGFVEFGKHLFKLGDDEQMDIMMKLPL